MKTLAVIVLAVGLAAAGYWFTRSTQPVEANSSLPTALARQGEFLVITTCRGDLNLASAS